MKHVKRLNKTTCGQRADIQRHCATGIPSSEDLSWSAPYLSPTLLPISYDLSRHNAKNGKNKSFKNNKKKKSLEKVLIDILNEVYPWTFDHGPLIVNKCIFKWPLLLTALELKCEKMASCFLVILVYSVYLKLKGKLPWTLCTDSLWPLRRMILVSLLSISGNKIQHNLPSSSSCTSDHCFPYAFYDSPFCSLPLSDLLSIGVC